MSKSSVIETISLVAFVCALLIGAVGKGSTYETAASVLFLAAGALFTHEIWLQAGHLWFRRLSAKPAS